MGAGNLSRPFKLKKKIRQIQGDTGLEQVFIGMLQLSKYQKHNLFYYLINLENRTSCLLFTFESACAIMIAKVNVLTRCLHLFRRMSTRRQCYY